MRFALIFLLVMSSVFAADTATTPTHMTVKLETVKGSGEDAMFAVWLETNDGAFVKTLQVFGKKKKYYDTLLAWSKARKLTAKTDVLDAVVGATISWEKSGSFSVPLEQGDLKLLSGKYQLRIEQRKDGAGHHKSFVFPLKEGYTGGEAAVTGYLSRVSISLGAEPKPKKAEKP